MFTKILPHWKKIALGTLLVIVLLSLSDCGGDKFKALREWRKKVDATLPWSNDQDRQAEIKIDSTRIIQTKIDSLEREVESLKDTASTLHTRNESLYNQLRRSGRLTTPTPEIAPYVELIDSQRVEIRVLNTIIVKKDSIITNKDTQISQLTSAYGIQKVRADSLQQLLITMPPIPTAQGENCRFLGIIKCPNRKQVAVATAVVTLVLANEARRSFKE